MNDSKANKAAVERCATHCDFERAKLVSRATWVCPDCGRDISIEYLYWAPVAHPEWFDRELDGTAAPNASNEGPELATVPLD